VTLIFGVIRTLNAAMTDYESVLGEIKRPEVQ